MLAGHRKNLVMKNLQAFNFVINGNDDGNHVALGWSFGMFDAEFSDPLIPVLGRSQNKMQAVTTSEKVHNNLNDNTVATTFVPRCGSKNSFSRNSRTPKPPGVDATKPPTFAMVTMEVQSRMLRGNPLGDVLSTPSQRTKRLNPRKNHPAPVIINPVRREFQFAIFEGESDWFKNLLASLPTTIGKIKGSTGVRETLKRNRVPINCSLPIDK